MGWNNNRLGLSAAAQPTNLRPATVHARGTAVLSNWLRSDQVWFALTRQTTLAPSSRAALERNGRVITVYKRESLVAASKGSFRAGRLRATQSKEDWVLWASAAALRRKERREIVLILQKVL